MQEMHTKELRWISECKRKFNVQLNLKELYVCTFYLLKILNSFSTVLKTDVD